MPTYTIIDDPDNPRPMQHPGITLVDADGGAYNPIKSAHKLTNTTVIDATRIVIPDLSFAIGANESYWFTALLVYDSTTTNDISVDITGPAGLVTLVWGAAGMASSATSTNFAATWLTTSTSGTGRAYGGSRAAGAAAVPVYLFINGTIINGTTAGTVQVRAAKNINTDTTSPADDLTIYVGSRLTAGPLRVVV